MNNLIAALIVLGFWLFVAGSIAWVMFGALTFVMWFWPYAFGITAGSFGYLVFTAWRQSNGH